MSGQNVRNSPEDLNVFLLKEKLGILIQISLTLASKCQIDNKSALVQVTITWTTVDQDVWRHMVWLVQNVLTHPGLEKLSL